MTMANMQHTLALILEQHLNVAATLQCCKNTAAEPCLPIPKDRKGYVILPFEKETKRSLTFCIQLRTIIVARWYDKCIWSPFRVEYFPLLCKPPQPPQMTFSRLIICSLSSILSVLWHKLWTLSASEHIQEQHLSIIGLHCIYQSSGILWRVWIFYSNYNV